MINDKMELKDFFRWKNATYAFPIFMFINFSRTSQKLNQMHLKFCLRKISKQLNILFHRLGLPF